MGKKSTVNTIKQNAAVVAHAAHAIADRKKISVAGLTYIGSMDSRPVGGKAVLVMFNDRKGFTYAEDVSGSL